MRQKSDHGQPGEATTGSASGINQGARGHKWITSTSQYLSFKEDRINAAIDLL